RGWLPSEWAWGPRIRGCRPRGEGWDRGPAGRRGSSCASLASEVLRVHGFKDSHRSESSGPMAVSHVAFDVLSNRDLRERVEAHLLALAEPPNRREFPIPKNGDDPTQSNTALARERFRVDEFGAAKRTQYAICRVT